MERITPIFNWKMTWELAITNETVEKMEGGFSKITSRGETVEKVPKQILG
ncbi:MAG TPA: hypothetical protein VEK32_10910 [Thermodesulfobacteriota bacterium]|nr:hypothetical protein [Thermodesulfobacteriota bacterium]